MMTPFLSRSVTTPVITMASPSFLASRRHTSSAKSVHQNRSALAQRTLYQPDAAVKSWSLRRAVRKVLERLSFHGGGREIAHRHQMSAIKGGCNICLVEKAAIDCARKGGALDVLIAPSRAILERAFQLTRVNPTDREFWNACRRVEINESVFVQLDALEVLRRHEIVGFEKLDELSVAKRVKKS